MSKTKPEAASGPLERYLEVLELVAAFPGALTLADVSSLLGLPKTTAHRLLKGLVRSGLAKDGVGGRTYNIGDRLMRLLHATSDDGWLISLAEPHLRQLTEQTAETCYVTRLAGTRVVVAVSQSPDVRWRGYVQPGSEMFVNSAATAKAIMAYQSPALVHEAVSLELPQLTSNTRSDPDWIEAELKQVRERGYATCIGEVDEGLAALAVPIILPDGGVFHALGMTGPLQRIMNERLQERIAALKQTAQVLATAFAIGHTINARDS